MVCAHARATSTQLVRKKSLCHTGRKMTPPLPVNSFDVVIHMQEGPPHTRFLAGCSSSFMRLAQHLTALRAWRWRCLPGR